MYIIGRPPFLWNIRLVYTGSDSRREIHKLCNVMMPSRWRCLFGEVDELSQLVSAPWSTERVYTDVCIDACCRGSLQTPIEARIRHGHDWSLITILPTEWSHLAVTLKSHQYAPTSLHAAQHSLCAGCLPHPLASRPHLFLRLLTQHSLES